MKTSSAKAKGRNLQKYVCSRILGLWPSLQAGDCSSRSMGAGGDDVLLSPAARKFLPISIECKSHARYAVYSDYKQAESNAREFEPILIIKQNNSKPLAIMDLDYYLSLERKAYEKSKSNSETSE